MKVLIEAHHPAHIHFWKYPVRELIERGHEVLMIGRDRDVMRRLLEVYDWIPAEIPKRRTGKNKFPLVEMLERQWAVARAISRFKPDVVASLMGSYTQSAKLFGVRNVIFTDSEFQHFNHRIAHPFADEIHTPECFYKDLGPKQRRYRSIHELSFLSPARFIRDASFLGRYPKLRSDRYIVLRLSAWNTFHDLDHVGIGDQVDSFVERVKNDYQIVISAEEQKVPPGLEEYALTVAPEDFHQLLAHSQFVLSEGASTASEAACLGVPCVYVNSTEERGYLRLLEDRYQLIRGFSEPGAGIAAALDWLGSLSEPAARLQFIEAAAHFIEDSIDPMDYIIEQLTRGNR